MITENIVLRSDFKKKLKHLSIDYDIYVSTMLIDSAKYILNHNVNVSTTDKNSDYENFTMKIDKSFKEEIKKFCKDKDVKMKDFWNEAAFIIIQERFKC